MKTIDYSIYLVTDQDMLRNISITDAVEQSILGGVTLVQLREKNASSRKLYETAKAVKVITDKYGIPLIINDRLDIAMAVDASGVHLGQTDIHVSIARKILGDNMIIGVSASTFEQAKEAIECGADYLGVGAIFPTRTKIDAKINSVENLKDIKKAFVNIPMVGIGGINKGNIHLVKDTLCDGVAVISAILLAKDIKVAANELKYIWNKSDEGVN